MADILEEAEFWLPSGFLTDEVVFMDKKDIQRSTTESCFPTEFRYDFDSVFNSSDEEDQLAELTRQLTLRNPSHKPIPSQQNFEKSRVISGSPQSTLIRLDSWSGRSPVSSNGGSPNGPSLVSSPPTTPFGANNDAWDLIYQAAGQVAKLKINGRDNKALLVPDHRRPSLQNPTSCYNTYLEQVREEQMVKQQQRCGVWPNKQVNNGWIYEEQQRSDRNRDCLRFEGLVENEKRGRPQAAWPSIQRYHDQQNQQVAPGMPAAFPGGNLGGSGVGGVKKQCAGTGVFLPRCYGSQVSSNPANSRKKPGCSTAWLPAKVGHSQFESRCQPRSNAGYMPDHDTFIARRNALLMQQLRNLRPEGARSYETSLPKDWTY